jgi:hypothetical protein
VHTGCCKNPTVVLDHLLDTMVRPSRAESSAAETGLVGTSN